MVVCDKKAYLESYGWTVGARDPRLNTDYPGAFMCAEPFADEDIANRNPPWCIVGDDLGALIEEAYHFLTGLVA